MTKAELQKATDEIRDHLKESELDKATEQLLVVSKKISYDAYEEALIISANWNQLERESRSSLIREHEEKVQRNQLIEQIMKFMRDLEGLRTKPNIPPAPTPPVLKKTNYSKYIIGTIAAGFFILLFIFWPKQADNEGMKSPTSKPPLTRKIPEKSAIQEERDTDVETQNERSNRTGNDIKSYQKYMTRGEEYFKSKDYERALGKFKEAALINNSSEIQTKIIETTERCYRQYFSKGMDFWNKEDYNNAKKAFEKAQRFKDISQVRAMIKRCEK